MNRDDEIRERCEAATPGPLYVVMGYEPNSKLVVDIDNRIIIRSTKADAEFFAHAREDVLYLLGKKARLLRELDEMRQRAEVAEAKIEQVRDAAKERGRALAQKGIRQ